jgi:hypothetical protein
LGFALVVTSADDFAGARDDGADGHFALSRRLARFTEGQLHETNVGVYTGVTHRITH